MSLGQTPAAGPPLSAPKAVSRSGHIDTHRVQAFEDALCSTLDRLASLRPEPELQPRAPSRGGRHAGTTPGAHPGPTHARPGEVHRTPPKPSPFTDPARSDPQPETGPASSGSGDHRLLTFQDEEADARDEGDSVPLAAGPGAMSPGAEPLVAMLLPSVPPTGPGSGSQPAGPSTDRGAERIAASGASPRQGPAPSKPHSAFDVAGASMPLKAPDTHEPPSGAPWAAAVIELLPRPEGELEPLGGPPRPTPAPGAEPPQGMALLTPEPAAGQVWHVELPRPGRPADPLELTLARASNPTLPAHVDAGWALHLPAQRHSRAALDSLRGRLQRRGLQMHTISDEASEIEPGRAGGPLP